MTPGTARGGASRARRRWLHRLLLVVAGLTVAFVLAEIGLRLAGVHLPRRSQRDEHRGTAIRPGIEFHFDDEGGALVRINTAGFRDREWEVPKPPGTFRIAVLGDSYVDAWQVSVEERFTERLGAALHASGHFSPFNVEVLNFGVGGYGTAQELQVLRYSVWKYSPDLVILAFLPYNDLRNNYEPLEKDPGRPYFVLKDGKLVLDDSFLSTPDHEKTLIERIGLGLVDHSRVFQLAYRARAKLRKLLEASKKPPMAAGDLLTEVGLDDKAFAEPSDADWREAWDVSERLILATRDEVKAHGSEFLLVVVTSGHQVHPNPKPRAEFMNKLGVKDLFYAEDRLLDFGRKEGVRTLALGRPFQEHAEKTRTVLHGFPNAFLGLGHWNAAGHELAAQLIAEEILKMAPGGR